MRHAAMVIMKHVARCIESYLRQLQGMAGPLCIAPGQQAIAGCWAAVWRWKALCQCWQSRLAVATQAR